MKKNRWPMIILIIIMSFALSACSNLDDDLKNSLDPDKPITVNVWHYYNGGTKEAFDSLVSQFNETIGAREGFVVESQSQGDVSQLANAVFDSANESIGSYPMPDIFASYPDNAYRVNKIVELVSLDKYFSQEELNEYRSEFLDEGRLFYDERLYILPIAKSSENLYVNKTDWEKFATKHNYSIDDLSTWEGIYDISKNYYEETSKAFFSIDASANFIIEASMQLGDEIFIYEEDGQVKFNLTEKVAKNIWSYYYRPYINGYFIKTGRFSSDDAKTGTILAYTGSTAGAAYFPKEVTIEQKTLHQIDPLILAYPYFKEGNKFAMQQGAGMCITKSDLAHEYAASIFLKWFTDKNQNLEFAVKTGYLPVKNEAIDNDSMQAVLMSHDISNPSIEASISTTTKMFDEYTFYNSKPFNGSYEVRNLLENNLYEKILVDLQILKNKLAEGNSRDEVIEEMISDIEFEKWYRDLLLQVDMIMNK